MAVAKLKMNADYGLVNNIRQKDAKLTINFAPEASQLFDSQTMLKAIAQTKYRATVNQVDGRYVVGLTIQPQMKDWLNQLIILLTNLANYRRQNQEGLDAKTHEK